MIDYEAWEKRAIESLPAFMKVVEKLINEEYIVIKDNKLIFNTDKKE